MVLRKLMGIFLITLMVGMASMATAGVPDLVESSVDWLTAGTPANPLVVYCLPDGNGNAFTQAVENDGSLYPAADATIQLTVLDGGLAAVPGVPFEDMVLNATGLLACFNGTTADADTDGSGQTTWAFPLVAGGWTSSNAVITINGLPVTGGGLPVHFNSADINADGFVDIIDVTLFSQDFYDVTHQYRSDFVLDGDVDINDVVKLAQGFGTECPVPE